MIDALKQFGEESTEEVDASLFNLSYNTFEIAETIKSEYDRQNVKDANWLVNKLPVLEDHGSMEVCFILFFCRETCKTS